MADQTQPRNGNGRESLTFSLGGRSIGLQVRDLLSVLLLVAGCVGGYVIYQGMHATQERLLTHQQAFQVSQHQAITEVKEGQSTTRTQLNDLVRDQNSKLQAQTETFLHAILEQRAYISAQVQACQGRLDAQTETLRGYLLRHQFNQGRDPADWVPLEGSAGVLEKSAR